MTNRARLFLLMIAIPVVAFAVAQGIIWKWEQSWQQGLAEKYPTVQAEQRTAFTFWRLCTDPAAAEFRAPFASSCSTVSGFAFMRATAVATGAVGIGWLGLIALAGRLARRSRILLLKLFRPGLYITNTVLICLIVIHGALAIAALYFGEGALLGRVHVGIVLGIGVGAVLGVVAMCRVSFSLVKAATTSVLGKRVSREEHPALWRVADDVARAVGVTPPDHIIVGLDPNFFVTEAHVRTLDGEQQGRTMFVSLPLCRIMTVEELRSVLGHELGHYKGQDTEFSTKFYPIYRGTYEGLRALYASGSEGASSLALLPGVAVLSFFLEAFAVAENGIGRERELAADRVGAGVAGAMITATALVKIHAFVPYWGAVHKAMAEVISEGKAYTNVSALFAESVRENVAAEALAGLDGRSLSHPTDSHPPLGLRLESLEVSLPEVQVAALDVTPADPSVELISNYEALEKELSSAEHYLLAQSIGGKGLTPT